MKSTQFTVEERKLIVETLLFASSVDVCAEWSPERYSSMIELAKKLNDPTIKLDDIYLIECGGFEEDEKIVEIMSNEFPNLPRRSIIID